ncbi:hypothetical protein ACFQ1R_02710 [Mariniflexile jejuense]|uniref:YhhN-like protein n=1 Tax=Mariniflexile jejuense TaxID=1173582 RepID=A0ABW3JHE6_9FLAO
MNKSKVLVYITLLLYLLSVAFQFNGQNVVANCLKSAILPTVTLLYFLTKKRKALFFTLFLVLFSISELLVLIENYLPHVINYYIGNSLYILAYTSLIIEIIKSISFLHIIKHHKIHLIILTCLNIYIVYVLQVIVNPYVEKTNEYYVELIYNIIMLSLLSVALLNYFHKDNLKSLYLFLAALCIVFGEVMWVAYTYISARDLLNVISTTLYVVSFYFFFKQSKLKHEIKQDEVSMLIG